MGRYILVREVTLSNIPANLCSVRFDDNEVFYTSMCLKCFVFYNLNKECEDIDNIDVDLQSRIPRAYFIRQKLPEKRCLVDCCNRSVDFLVYERGWNLT